MIFKSQCFAVVLFDLKRFTKTCINQFMTSRESEQLKGLALCGSDVKVVD